MIMVQRLLVSAACYVALAFPASVVSHAAGNSPLPSVASYLDVAPQNCPTSIMVHQDHPGRPLDGGWIGGGALVGHSMWIVHAHRATLSVGVNRTKYGYPQKVFWQLARGVHVVVTLRGWNLRTGQQIWFGHPVPPDPDHHLIAWPAAVVRDHRAPTLTFVPSAGCYMLHAEWRTGSWSIPFAAGYFVP
jgi:hypothetical protein